MQEQQRHRHARAPFSVRPRRHRDLPGPIVSDISAEILRRDCVIPLLYRNAKPRGGTVIPVGCTVVPVGGTVVPVGGTV